MAGSTTRLGLYKPGGGSTGLILPDETADIDKINSNMDLIDAAVGARNVTSVSRPATPFDGQTIYETDTRNTMVWSSGASRWNPVGIPNAAGSALRDALFPTPVAGNTVVRTDRLGKQEVFNGSVWLMLDGTIYPASLSSFVSGTIPVQSSDGWIQINNNTAVGFDGVFTGVYRDYVIEVDDLATVSAATVSWLLRAGGVNTTGADYHYEYQYTSVATAAAGGLVSQTSVQMNAGATVFSLGGTLRLLSPALTRYTRYQHNFSGALSTTTEGLYIAGGRHNLTNVYDGFYFAAGSAMTGFIRIKGIA